MTDKLRDYPFCLNSKRWLTAMFLMNLPKSCPNETEKECKYEKCVYYESREASPYLLKMIKIMKSYGMDIISPETTLPTRDYPMPDGVDG